MAMCIESEINIPQENIEAAWAALNTEYDRLDAIDHEHEDVEYLVYDMIENGVIEEGPPAKKIQSMLSTAGFDGGIVLGKSETAEKGIVSITPNDDRCYYEEHQQLWRLLAPFVKDGSYIVFVNDDDETIRWRFKDKALHVDEMIRYVWSSDPDAAEHLAVISASIDRSMLKFVLSNCLDYMTGLRAGKPPTDMKRVDLHIEQLQELVKKA